jgi:GH25 family lysozyme M1 (1,4-beta-N-acetylmuramidase)
MTVIDISHYQGTINWNTIAKAHSAGLLDGVIMKAAQGTAVGGYPDPTFRTNQTFARAAATPIGYYLFAMTACQPTVQAQAFLDIIGPPQPGESIWLDIEDTPQRGIRPTDVGWATDWLTTIQTQTGVTPGIYLNTDLLHRYNWAAVANRGFPLWLANYGANNGTPSAVRPTSGIWTRWTLWQYTSTGNHAGITPVDASLLADGIKFTDLGKKGPTMPATPGTWSLHDLADTLDVVDSLYIAAGGPTPPPDRYGWAANITDTLSRGEDPAGSLGFIWWALRNPDAAKQLQ